MRTFALRRELGTLQIAAVAQDLADLLSAALPRPSDLHLDAPRLGGTTDIHMRAPVRMFFVLDPLVAITNALATHALYRGLLLA